MRYLVANLCCLLVSACAEPCPYDGSIGYCNADVPQELGWVEPRLQGTLQATANCLGASIDLFNVSISWVDIEEELGCPEVDNVVGCFQGKGKKINLLRSKDPELTFAHELGHLQYFLFDGDLDHNHLNSYWFGRDNGKYGGLTSEGSIVDCVAYRLEEN